MRSLFGWLSTLRFELKYQQIAVAAALGAAALGLMATSMWVLGLLLMIFAPVPLAFFILMLNFNTLDAARRVREIETDVNALAGKRLLVWETDHRLYKVSYLDRVKSVLRGRSDAG